MEICLTQRSDDNRLCGIHHRGQITMREDGVHFWSPQPVLCRIHRGMGFEGLKDKVWSKVQVTGDDRDVTSITYRKPYLGDDGRVSFSSMTIKTDEDVANMLNIHDTLQGYKPLELYVETQRSVNEILRRVRRPEF